MPTLNRIRLVNIRYNDDKRLVQDELLNIKEQHTLALLENAGGKSVLTKFMMQPIMWIYDKYPTRSASPYFDMRAYFKTNTEPCYVLEEFVLENNEGYLLLGVGITAGENNGPLKKIAFVHHYTNREDTYSIRNIALFTKKNQVTMLLGLNEVYSALKPHMNCYRSSESSHKQEFRNHLLEYHINIKEWEKVHARVVSIEGGLAEVFANSSTKTTTELLRNWILEAIEGKVGTISEETTQIEQIKANLRRYIQQKIESRADMEQLEQLRLFIEDVNQLYQLTLEKETTAEEYQATENNLIHMSHELQRLKMELTEKIALCEKAIAVSNHQITTLNYHKDSYVIKERLNQLREDRGCLHELQEREREIDELSHSVRHKIALQEARKKYDELIETQGTIELKKDALLPMSEKVKELEEKTRNIKYTIKHLCEKEITSLMQEVKEKTEKETTCSNLLFETNEKLKRDKEELKLSRDEQMVLSNSATKFETNRDRILEAYTEIPAKFRYKDFMEQSEISKFFEDTNAFLLSLSTEITNLKEEEILKTEQVELARDKKQEEGLLAQSHNSELVRVNQDYENFLSEKNTITDMLMMYRYKETDIDRLAFVLQQLRRSITEKDQLIRDEEKKQDRIIEQINFYQHDQLKLNHLVEKSLRQNGIDYDLGIAYLKNSNLSMDEKVALIRRIPILPYAILASSGNYEKIKKIVQKEFTDALVPVLIREKLEEYRLDRQNSLFLTSDGLGFYAGYNEELIDQDYTRQQLHQVEQELELSQTRIESQQKEREALLQLCSKIEAYPYDRSAESLFLRQINDLKASIQELTSSILAQATSIKENKERLIQIGFLLKEKGERYQYLESMLKEMSSLVEASEQYYHTIELIDQIKDKLEEINLRIEKNTEYASELSNSRVKLESRILNLETSLTKLKIDEAEFLSFEETGTLEFTDRGEVKSKKLLLEMLNQYQNRSEYTDIRLIQEDIIRLQKKEESQKLEFEQTSISVPEVSDIRYLYASLLDYKTELDKLSDKSIALGKEIAILSKELNQLETEIEKRKSNCKLLYHKEFDPEVEKLDFDSSIQREEEEKKQQNFKLTRSLSTREDIERLLPNLEQYALRSMTGETELEMITIENYGNSYRRIVNLNQELEKKLYELNSKIDRVFMNCNNTYVVKRNNKMIGEYLAKMQAYQKSNIFEEIKSRLLMQIELYSGQEEMLKEQFVQIYGTSLDYTKKVHEELLTIDKNSKINNKKLFELAGIAKEGLEEKFEAFLDEVVENIVTAVKDITYLDKVVTTYTLLDNYISLDSIQAYALKFNAFDEQIRVKFEDTHNGGVCSGAQRTIIAFAILKCIMYYTNDGLIKDSRNATSFMFLDNPFGVMSTDQFLDLFFEIANRFHTTLYSWTDLSKPAIIKKHKNIYSFKISKVGKKEYITIKDEIEKDSYETINTDYLQEETQQLAFDLE